MRPASAQRFASHSRKSFCASVRASARCSRTDSRVGADCAQAPAPDVITARSPHPVHHLMRISLFLLAVRTKGGQLEVWRTHSHLSRSPHEWLVAPGAV